MSVKPSTTMDILRNVTQDFLKPKVNDTSRPPPHLEEDTAIAFWVFSVLITISNCLICTLVILYKKLRTYTNAIIVSLATSDILYGAIWLPLYIHFPFSDANGYVNFLVLSWNISNLCCLTLERAISVTRPFQYRYIMSKYTTHFIVVTWVVPIVTSLMPLAWDAIGSRAERDENIHNIYLIIVLFVFLLIPYVFIISVYITILCYVHKRKERLAKISSGSEEGKRFRMEFKVLRLFFFITVLSSIGWVPIFYSTLCGMLGCNDSNSKKVMLLGVFGLNLNSLSNGFIYAFFKPDFKKVIKRIFIRCCSGDTFRQGNNQDSRGGTALRSKRSSRYGKAMAFCRSPKRHQNGSPKFENFSREVERTVVRKITVL